MTGPKPMGREERLAFAREILRRALAAYGDAVTAAGLYGSMARGTDGPYSDIEMYVVLATPGADFSHEWSYGPGKVEVDFYGEDLLLERAASVEGRWPLTHGSVTHVLPLYDPTGFFVRLRETAISVPPERFRAVIPQVLTGEMYEFVGKWRNLKLSGQTAYLPYLACQTAQYGAYILGLHHRQTFTTGARVLEEALALPDRPGGFDALCELVVAGNLADSADVINRLEAFWQGLVAWAAVHGYPIDSAERIPF